VGLLKDPHYPGPPDVALLWRAVQVNVVNEQTVAFTLPEPFAPFLDYTTFGLLPAHKLEGVAAADLPDQPFNQAPVGSGPFQFVGLTADDDRVTSVILAAFADYHGQPPLLND